MSRRDKRNKFVEQKKSRTGTYFLVGILAIGVIVFGAYKLLGQSDTPAGVTNVGEVDYNSQFIDPVQIDVIDSGGNIVIDLNKVKSDKAVTFDIPGINFTLNNGTPFDYVPIIGYVSPKGNVIMATSLCEPCSGITFHFEGDHLVCNACGTRWELEGLKGISGGCTEYPPETFNYTVEGDKILIKRTDLENWQPRVIG
ncbi:MAG: hypothetical protein CVU89_12775 [Firmicutes bacterium HGW-Firmicutes-14]|jgi:hypothetical protein|nr:MAG: hypothetical protein CVU89_12775 [Firmicutes bacterium HGW-Firmicutes-14]